MSNSISRRHFMSGVAAAGLATGTTLLPGAATASPPDPAYVRKRGRGWRVLPNGTDDHGSLEWAMRHTEPGGTVKLVEGTYKLGSVVVVANFDGKIVGEGPDKTTMTCADQFNYELWEAPGGGRDQGLPKPPPFPRVPIAGTNTKTAPGLILFYKTPLQAGEDPDDRANRIEIRDLYCRGAMIGDDWMFGDEVLCFTIINSIDWNATEVPQVTTRQDVLISGVDVDGYKTPEFGAFGNACACISILGGILLTPNYNLDGETDGDALGLSNGGFLGLVLAEGDVTVRNCKLRNCRLGPAIVGYKNSRLVFENMSTDGCRADCVRLLDNSNCDMYVRNCDLFCDSFILPPEWAAGGAPDQPSSLGCILGLQGVTAALGFPQNIQWLTLAVDPAAHAAHPEAGPFGTWRPLGPAFLPEPSRLTVVDNSCESSSTPRTYCVHIADLANAAFGVSTLDTTIRNNSCSGSETCVSLEHIVGGDVRDNECSSLAYGVELHNSVTANVQGNEFSFPAGVTGCEIRTLVPGEKIDLSRVVPGAGMCTTQG